MINLTTKSTNIILQLILIKTVYSLYLYFILIIINDLIAFHFITIRLINKNEYRLIKLPHKVCFWNMTYIIERKDGQDSLLFFSREIFLKLSLNTFICYVNLCYTFVSSLNSASCIIRYLTYICFPGVSRSKTPWFIFKSFITSRCIILKPRCFGWFSLLVTLSKNHLIVFVDIKKIRVNVWVA